MENTGGSMTEKQNAEDFGGVTGKPKAEPKPEEPDYMADYYKRKNTLIFGHTWEEIDAMQKGKYRGGPLQNDKAGS
jgi:hypothetical protein